MEGKAGEGEEREKERKKNVCTPADTPLKELSSLPHH